jgi:hypothetical protein
MGVYPPQTGGLRHILLMGLYIDYYKSYFKEYFRTQKEVKFTEYKKILQNVKGDYFRLVGL